MWKFKNALIIATLFAGAAYLYAHGKPDAGDSFAFIALIG
jgi:hypothetical protein